MPTRKLAPSQTCPRCNVKRKKDLSERFHICGCGVQQPLDRDVAAAMVMLMAARGQELSPSVVESPNPAECGNMRQFGTKKRQKLIPSDSLV